VVKRLFFAGVAWMSRIPVFGLLVTTFFSFFFGEEHPSPRAVKTGDFFLSSNEEEGF